MARVVIEGPGGNGIGRSIASMLHLQLLESPRKSFPDGESDVVISADNAAVDSLVNGNEVIIVQSAYPMQDKRLHELYILADDMRSRGAGRITAVIPYLAYARQNRRFEGKANAVSVNTVLKMLNSAGVTELVVVAPHNFSSLSQFNGTVKVVDAIGPLAREISGKAGNPFVLAPDKGAWRVGEKFSGFLGCSYASIDKRRDPVNGDVVILNAPEVSLEGMDVVIVDDMISSGGTVAQAARFAYQKGARSVVAAAAHLLMVDGAYEKLKSAGVREVYGTNTIPQERAKVVDISGSIADAIKEMGRKGVRHPL